MSYGYGGQQNPFDDRNGAGPGYGGGGLPSGPSYRNQGYEDYGSNNVEMTPLTSNVDPFSDNNPNAALEEISEINRGIDDIQSNLRDLRMLQQRSLDDADSSPSSSTNRELERLSADTMANYRRLTQRVRELKSNPSNQQRFGQQVRRVDTRLKDAIREYQQVESGFRKKTEEQMARQFRIVRPDATEEEVKAAVHDQSGGQIFQQALEQSSRRGQAMSVRNAVRDRHAQLQQIEKQMIELAQLFQDMDTLVVQQDVAIANIEQRGEEVVENLDKGNVEIGTAVNTARATRKKKWICLGVCVAIIIIIVAIIAIYFATKNAGNKN